MNYLAHLYLAGDGDQALVGNLLGDFVKGRIEPGRWPPEIARGIQLHRLVDSYTDRHPAVLRSKRRISPARRRFAGIIVDIGYDHFLARHWHRFSDSALEAFSRRAYRALQRHHDLLPERLQQVAPRMAAEDWLGAYRRLDRAALALDKVSVRLSRPNSLVGAGAELEACYEQLEADFLAFFPSLIEFADQRRSALRGQSSDAAT